MTTALAPGEMWRATARDFGRDRATYLTIAAAFVLLPAMTAEVFGPPSPARLTDVRTPVVVLQLVLSLLGLLAQLTIARLVLKGGAPRDALAAALPRVPVMFLAGLLTALTLVPAITLIGTALRGMPAALLPGIALLLPAAFVASRLALAAPAIATRDVGATAALRLSWRATAGNGWRVFATVAVFAGVFLGGTVLATGIGAALGATLTLLGGKPLASFVAALIPALVSTAYAALGPILLANLYRRLVPPG